MFDIFGNDVDLIVEFMCLQFFFANIAFFSIVSL